MTDGLNHTRKYQLTPDEAYQWTQQFESSKNYLAKLNSERHKKKTAQYFWFYCEWAKGEREHPQTPDELLTLKSGFGGTGAEQLLDRFVTAKVRFPESARWQAINAVRGFYRVNYRALESQAGKMERVQEKQQRFLSKQQRFELFKCCYTPRDKVVVCMFLCSAVALETMSKLTWGRFESDWMRQELPHISIPGDLLKGHNKGRYRGVRQETFVTPECKQLLIDYREWVVKTFGWRWSDGDHVFVSIKDNVCEPLGYEALCHVVSGVSKRAGVAFSSHDGRRIVQTSLENAGVVRNQVQKIKGRKVRGEDNPYSLPAIRELREAYGKALGELEFLGAGFQSPESVLSREKLEWLDLMIEAMKKGKLHIDK